jgi:uncharacterized membrane protein YbhN (UPF0104 family)
MKRRLWVIAKFVLTAALLGAVLRRVPLGQVPGILGSLGICAVAGAVLLTAAAVLVSAWRWHRVLRYLGEEIALSDLIGDTLVGTTYNLILPAAVGGDLIRAYRCGKRAQRADRAWAAVVFERVVGLLSLVLVSSVGLLSVYSDSSRALLLTSLGMTVALATALAFAPAPLRLAARVSRLPAARLGQALEHIARAFAGPLASPAARLETFGWSLLYQLVALSILLVAALGWNEPSIVPAVYLGVPIALVGSMVPITIGGLGLRESLFVAVLQPFGLTPERAFALSIVWLASNVLVAVVGLLPVLLGNRE